MTESIAQRSALIAGARDREGNDPIFALNGEARTRAAAGESIVNATIGALMNDDGTLSVMPSVAEGFAAVSPIQAAGYAPISGVPAFLDAAVRDLFGDSPLGDMAVATSAPGGTGAIYQAMLNFLEPGQKGLTTSYFWGPYPVIANQAQRGMDTFRMFGDDGRLDLEAFSDAVDRHIREQGRVLAILNFPCHNPTGYSLDPNEWRTVADMLRAAGERAPVAVLLDCAYYRFAGEGGNAWLDVVPTLLESCTVLAAWTASKSFTQYGARIGTLVALHPDADERRRLANALNYTCRSTWSNCNHQGQLAVARLLTDPELSARADAERAELAAMLQSRVDAFNRETQGTGLRVPRYEGGFFVAVFAEDGAAAGASMREDGVYVVPIQGAVRVALCSTPAAQIPRLVASLTKATGSRP